MQHESPKLCTCFFPSWESLLSRCCASPRKRGRPFENRQQDAVGSHRLPASNWTGIRVSGLLRYIRTALDSWGTARWPSANSKSGDFRTSSPWIIWREGAEICAAIHDAKARQPQVSPDDLELRKG